MTSRRHFLGSSAILLGVTALDALTTPLWRWQHPLQAKVATKTGVQFVNVTKKAGLTILNVWGATDHKSYIIEAKGSGLAFFDYDHDGWLDIYLTNGTQLGKEWPKGEAPTSHLYKNNREGTFTDVTEKSGLARTGWQTGVCAGNYDNDGQAVAQLDQLSSGDYRTQTGVGVLQISASAQQDDAYLSLLGDIYSHLGDAAKASEIFRSAIRRNPDNY